MTFLKGLDWKRLGGLIGLAFAVVLHAVLKEALAGSTAAASLLAPGGHVPLGTLALVGGLVFLRVIVFVAIPGLLLAGLGIWVLGRLMARGAEGNETTTSGESRP